MIKNEMMVIINKTCNCILNVFANHISHYLDLWCQFMIEMECLVIMPFHSDFDDVFKAIQSSVSFSLPDIKFNFYWLKEVIYAGKITDDIIDGIQMSTLCIADITGNNPNVMWEIGYAMALGKKIIIISQDISSKPFDLQVHRIIKYQKENLEQLKKDLNNAVSATFKQYDLITSKKGKKTKRGHGQIIAITGSMNGDENKLLKRISNSLYPYLSPDNLWLTGTWGNTDEAIVEYLLQFKQKITGVGFSNYDLTKKIEDYIESDQISFIDPTLENFPKGLNGPSERDKFYCMKADLIILLWDGSSKGTQTLIKYFMENSKNVLIIFI